MDAWWPRLVEAEFGPALGDDALRARCSDDAAARRASSAATPGRAGLLRRLVGLRLQGPARRSSTRASASRALVARLLRQRRARRVPHGAAGVAARRRSTVDPQRALRPRRLRDRPATRSCFDQNRSTVASAIAVPPFPFQNRPDVPADRRADATPAALTGSYNVEQWSRFADSSWSPAPSLQDPNFFRTVVLIVEHNDEGAMGIVLNRDDRHGARRGGP